MGMSGSPSSRRAWIEIVQTVVFGVVILVALLAEGVDRNLTIEAQWNSPEGRPPRGGRG